MAPREPELYRDKIEVSLDGRQVFYLFFGGAVIACLVFVLGVMVGKRVEARGHLDRAGTSAERDPLAALDRLDADGRAGLSFRQALTSGAAPASEVDKTIAELEHVRTLAAIAPAKAAVVAHDDSATRDDHTADSKPAKSEAKTDLKADGKEAKPAEIGDDDKPAHKNSDKADKSSKTDSKSDVKADAKKDGKGKYTLQLSAFQDRGEAEHFLASIKNSNLNTFITEAKVDGKGTFYRVRAGNFHSYDDAVDAKAEFERKVKKSTYVSRL